MGREVGGGFRMGNTRTLMADSSQCMAKPIHYCKVKKKKKASACQAGDPGSNPGEGNGSPFQWFCLGSPMDRGAWWATVHGVSKSQTELSDFATPWIVAHLPLSGEFSRREYWGGLPFPSPGDLTQGLNPGLLHCRQILYHLSHQGSPKQQYSITIM